MRVKVECTHFVDNIKKKYYVEKHTFFFLYENLTSEFNENTSFGFSSGKKKIGNAIKSFLTAHVNVDLELRVKWEEKNGIEKSITFYVSSYTN